MKTFPHIDLRNRHYCDWREFLQKADRWSASQAEEYQLSQVKRIVRHAYENTLGYRKLYANAGVSPNSVKSLEDLRKFPTVTKEMIRDGLESFSAPTRNRVYVTTGGSTGIPFGFYRDSKSFAKELASKAHQYS